MSVTGISKYKDTAIGWVPNEWDVTSFGSLLATKPEYGANASAGEFCDDNSVRYLRITDINDSGGLIDSGKKYIPNVIAKDYLLADKDILIARTGNTVGKSLIFRHQMGVCAFAGYLIRFRVGEKLDCNFAAQFLRSDNYWTWVKSSSKVGAQPNINAQQYQSMLVPLPPLPEQWKIAAILKSVDDKLGVIARQIATTQTLKQGLMQNLFSRGVGTQNAEGRWVPHTDFKDSELGEIPSKWHVGKVGDYVAALRSGVSVNAEDRPHNKSELGILKVSCVIKGKFLPNNHKTVLETELCRVAEPVLGGRIIISRANTPSLVGESAFVAEGRPDLFLPDKLWQTEPSNVPHSVRWLAFYLQSAFSRQEISKAATGTSGSMKNIAKPAFLGIPMPLMDIDEQDQIARILSSVTEKLDLLHTKQSKFKELKSGLMQKLLTGEWRVKCDVLVAEIASPGISATNVAASENEMSSLMEEAL